MEWIREHLWETWLVAAVVLGAIELISLDLIFLMLATGCLVAMVAALLAAPAWLTVVLALGTSLGALVLLRPGLLRRLHAGEDLLVGAEALVGRSARVLTDLDRDTPGRVKIGGEEWSAVPSEDELRIPAGQNVEVVAIRGATAVVRLQEPRVGLPDPTPQEPTETPQSETSKEN